MTRVFDPIIYNRRSVVEIDRIHGTRCGTVLSTAIAIEPLLASTVVVAEELESCAAYSSMYAGGDTEVVLSTGESGFTYDFNNILETRFVRLHQLFERLGRPVLIGDAREFIFAHELGHAVLYLNFQRDFPGENDRYLDELDTDPFTELPLSTSSGIAREAWRNNSDGYRTYMQSIGYTEDSFEEALIMNSFVYSQLKTESLCDDFALWVLAKMNMDRKQP